jgi:lipopolysaccharide transport system ATP-binding protein
MEKNLRVSTDIIRSWVDTSHLHVTYEQLLDDEQASFERIMEYCGIDATKKRIGEAVRAVSFEQLAQRRRGVEDVNSHQRKGVAGDWRNYFDDDLKERFKDLYGDVLIAGGYESDHDW